MRPTFRPIVVYSGRLRAISMAIIPVLCHGDLMSGGFCHGRSYASRSCVVLGLITRSYVIAPSLGLKLTHKIELTKRLRMPYTLSHPQL